MISSNLLKMPLLQQAEGMAMRSISVCMAVVVLWTAISRPATADESPSPRQRVENMADAEKEELRRKQERFERLDPARREQLRQLHRELDQTPHARHLRQVMARYDEWLKTLAPGQRAELLELPAQERVARIKQIKQEQESRRVREMTARQLEPEDVRVLFTWVYEFVVRHESEILQRIPPPLRARIARIDEPRRKTEAILLLWQRHPNPRMPKPTVADIATLASRLSSRARGTLEAIDGPEQQAVCVQAWIRAAWISRFHPHVDEKELERFFSELDPRQRERLERMPSRQMREELRRMYFIDRMKKRFGDGWHHGGASPGGHRPGGPHGPGNRPHASGPRHHGRPPSHEKPRP